MAVERVSHGRVALDRPGRSRWRLRPLLPARLRAVRRPRWWEEVLFIGLSYWLYSLVRNGVPTHERMAVQRAHDLLSFERGLHIDVEHSVNNFLASVKWLAVGANYYYATLHFVVTVAVLVWLYHRYPLRYRSVRTVLYATNVIALAGFWLCALAPPRLIGGGYTDTVAVLHTWGSYASGDLASASNQYAAMPSLHIGWSLWCAVAIVRLARRRWVRVLGALYPVATLFVIIGTANHFLLDAVGGVAVLMGGFAVQRAMSGRAAFQPPLVLPQLALSQPVSVGTATSGASSTTK